jgi:hypothetical protein
MNCSIYREQHQVTSEWCKSEFFLLTSFRRFILLPPLPLLLLQEAGIVLLDGFRIRVVRSTGLLVDSERTLQERLGLLVRALGGK